MGGGGQYLIHRLSCHWLPIERGRYVKLPVPRNERICTHCKSDIGDELHAMFYCNDTHLSSLRFYFTNLIYRDCRQPRVLSLKSYTNMTLELKYLLMGNDKNVTISTKDWIKEVNDYYKQ